MYVATFSIVAWDAETRQLGVATQSKFLAVGSVVPWARANVGAVATQAWVNATYGLRGLDLLAKGHSPEEVLRALVDEDPERNVRQVGIVDAYGRIACYTGSNCLPWAGHLIGEGFCCLGNILAGEQVLTAMADAYRSTSGPLAERLVAALTAGQEAGGDWRGQESAAVLVVKEGGGFGGHGDRYVDLRVDHADDPIGELRKLLAVHRRRFAWREAEKVQIDEDLALILQAGLHAAGYYQPPFTGKWDSATANALRRFCEDSGLDEAQLKEGIITVRTVQTLQRLYTTR